MLLTDEDMEKLHNLAAKVNCLNILFIPCLGI